jgi:hypothetical protein
MSTRVKDGGEFFEAEIATFDRFWQFQFLARSSRAFKPVTLVRRVPKMWILLSSGRVSILFLIGRKTIKRFTSIRLPATAAVPQGLRLALETVWRHNGSADGRPSGSECSTL